MPIHDSITTHEGCRMGLLMVILTFLTSIASIWVIVSFILYLFKDQLFNWWSVAFTILGFACVGTLFIWMLANDKY